MPSDSFQAQEGGRPPGVQGPGAQCEPLLLRCAAETLQRPRSPHTAAREAVTGSGRRTTLVACGGHASATELPAQPVLCRGAGPRAGGEVTAEAGVWTVVQQAIGGQGGGGASASARGALKGWWLALPWRLHFSEGDGVQWGVPSQPP